MDEWQRKECPHYEEEHDMGATIPLCRKDGSICDGCSSIHNPFDKINKDQQSMMLVLFLMACAMNKSYPEGVTDDQDG